MREVSLAVMSEILETMATAEDASHLRLHVPLDRLPRGPIHVQILLEESTDDLADDSNTAHFSRDQEDVLTVDERAEAERIRRMSPEERAADFVAWVKSHKGGPGLSDWAVSRDSIYD